MARARLTDQSDDLDRDIPAEFDDVTERVKDEEATLDEMLAEFGSTADDVVLSFKIYKVRANSKLTDFCFEGTKDDFPIVPRVQRECGGGTYVAFIYKTINGKTTLWKKPSFGVLELRHPVQIALPSADPNFSKLLELLERQSEQRAAQKPMSVVEIATAGAAIISALAPVFQLLRGNGGNSLSDQLDTLAKLKDLTTEAPAQDDSWGGMLRTALPAFLEASANARATPPARQLPSPENPQAPTPEQIQHAQMRQLQQNLRYMITRAQKNSPPELYADFLEDNLPAEYLQMLTQPGAYEFLVTIEPAIATYKPWFDALLQTLAAGPMDDEGDAPADENGAPEVVPQRSASIISPGYDATRFSGGASDPESDETEGA